MTRELTGKGLLKFVGAIAFGVAYIYLLMIWRAL